MATLSNKERLARDIEDARGHVARTTVAHSQGKVPVEALNEANDRLANAHARYDEHEGGKIPHPRYLAGK